MAPRSFLAWSHFDLGARCVKLQVFFHQLIINGLVISNFVEACSPPRPVLPNRQCRDVGSQFNPYFFYRRSLFTINNAHSKNIVPRTWPTKFSTVKATKRTSNARVWQLAPTWRRQPGTTSKVWLQPRVQSGDSHALPGLPTGWTAPTAGAVNPSVLNKFSQWSLPDCLISFED